jgi:hypothetical protein
MLPPEMDTGHTTTCGYSLAVGRSSPMWQSHLAKVEVAAATTLRAERIPLVEKTFAILYIMKSK